MRFQTGLLLLLLSLLVASAGCRSANRGPRSGTRPVVGNDSGVVDPPEEDGSVDRPDGGGEGCEPGLTACGESCVDTWSDSRHCGGCFTECGAESSCIDGTCTTGCTPSCGDRECGSDGCGGSCGTCPSGYACGDGVCIAGCTPSCAGRECGSDGCGGSCGTCSAGYACDGSYCVSTCTPSCSGRTCGSDGCGGSCGTCSAGYTCSTSGTCVGGPVTPGESCSAPISIASSGGTRTFTFTGRSADHTAFSCGSTSGQPDVVFSWAPWTSGTATIRAAGPTSSLDTVLAVFSSSSCTSTYEVGCNDDESSGVYSSSVTLSVSAGTTYYIAVAPYGTTTPTETITLTVTAP